MSRQRAMCCYRCDKCGNLYRVGENHKCLNKKRERRAIMKGYVLYTEVTKEILDDF